MATREFKNGTWRESLEVSLAFIVLIFFLAVVLPVLRFVSALRDGVSVLFRRLNRLAHQYRERYKGGAP